MDIQAARGRCEAVIRDSPKGARLLRWVFQPTRKGWGHVWAEIKVDEDGMVGTTGLPGSVRVPEYIGEFIAHAREDLPSALATITAVLGFVEDHYKDGVCLNCGWRSGDGADHKGCWVGALDATLEQSGVV